MVMVCEAATETLPNCNAAAPYWAAVVNAWEANTDLGKLRMMLAVCIVQHEEAGLSGVERYG